MAGRTNRTLSPHRRAQTDQGGHGYPRRRGSIRLRRQDLAEGFFQEAIPKASRSSDKILLAAWYNLACGEAVREHRDAAFEYLGKAAGLRGDVAVMATDEHLKSLRGDPQVAPLIAQARSKAWVQKAN